MKSQIAQYEAMAIGPPSLLAFFLLLSITLCAADSKGVQLTLQSIDGPRARRSLQTRFGRKQTFNDAYGGLATPQLPALAPTGYLGWETLQLNVALGTPGKCMVAKGNPRFGSSFLGPG